MDVIIRLTVLSVLVAAAVAAGAETGRKTGRNAGAELLQSAESHVYRKVNGVELKLYVFRPKSAKAGEKRPAIVFFFGGGWVSGSPAQFVRQCQYLASRGMVAITADYRVKSRHNVQVPDCLADAREAVRWVRAHASELGVDPERIAAGGGSAGGHLAACIGVIPDTGYLRQSLSGAPNALVLFNPVMALAPDDRLSERYNSRLGQHKQKFGDDPTAVSPLHHMRAGLPPTIMFFGSADALKESAIVFAEEAKKLGNRCELKIYEGPGHGFFNFGREGNQYFVATLRDADLFLGSLGYVEGKPTIDEAIRAKHPPQ